MPLVDIFDHKGFSLLHTAAFRDGDDCGIALIEMAKQTITKEEIKAWINAKTLDEGFTCLHFAAFRGNLNLI